MKKPTLRIEGDLSHDEVATILAALRFWQEHRAKGGNVPEHFDHFETAQELSQTQIDALCERINLGPEEDEPFGSDWVFRKREENERG